MGKIKLNKDGLKGIFINHVEKLVLGMVLLVFGVFVYSSLGLEGLPGDQTPNKLIQSAQSAEKSITNPENAKDVLASVAVSSGYVQRAKDRLIPTDGKLYVGTHPITPSYAQEGSKRPDPTWLPPEKVEVVAMTGGLVYWMKNPDEDELAKKDNAVATPKADPVKKKKKANQMENFGYGYGPADGADMAGMAAAGPIGMPGMSGMPVPGGDGAATMTGGTMASPLDRPGFIAQQGAGYPMISRSRSCVAVKAVVPVKKQWEAYEKSFSTALGYNPTRDNPRYLSFTAERIEVSDDPAAPLDWSKAVKVGFTTKTYKEVIESGYAGFGQEIADPRYLQMGILTFPVPPFVNRNLEQLALHTDVPKMTNQNMALPAAGKGELDKDGKKKKADPKTKAEETDEPGFAQATGPGVGLDGMPGGSMGMAGMGMAGSSGMSMPGMPGGMPGMPGGMPGMPGGMPGMPGMPGGMPGMPGMGGLNNDGTGGMSGTESMGMNGMGMGMMSGGYGYGDPSMGGSGMMGGMAARGPIVPHILIRFFDFAVEPGKTYRYRVNVTLEDPNHPQLAQMEPSDRYLDDSVKKRMLDVAAEEKASTRAVPRKFWVRTDWSQPSDPIKVEVRPLAYAGQVAALKLGASPEKTQDKVLIEEPQAKVMSVVWDPTHATEVTGITDVLRGSYLNFIADGQAVHPVSLIFKSLAKYDFQTEQLIADMRGGEELAGKEKESPLLAPGQFAIVDDQGRLVVRNEFDDWEYYRRLTLPEAPEPVSASFSGGLGGDDGSGMGMGPGGMMMPGPPKKGRSAREK